MRQIMNYDEIINLKNKLPLNFNEDNNLEFFRNFSSYTFKNYPAKFLKNIRISNNCVAFNYFNIIKESCATADMYAKYSKDYKFFLKYCIPQFNFSSQKFVLFANEFYSNYFHWHENLLGLIALQENNLLKGKKILMPKKYRNFKFIVESLKLLGIKDSDIFTINKKSHIKTPELTFQGCGGFNPLLVNILRDKLTNNVKNKESNKKNNSGENNPERNNSGENNSRENDFGDKIYISREGEKLRFVENEEETMELMTKYGFKKVKMQNYSYQEQIEICHNAKYIIGPHGAGLTNMLFMKNNSYILELSPKEDRDFFTGFYFLANACNHFYLYQRCKMGSNSVALDSHHGSLFIDILQLEKNIKIMLNHFQNIT